jgi:iron complex outermembrane receptor protein
MAICLPVRAWPLATLLIAALSAPKPASAQSIPTPVEPPTSGAAAPAAPAKEEIHVLEKFIASERSDDPYGLVPTQPVGTAVGFSRRIEETPRSISIVSSELIDKVGIRDADQLFQVVPGTYTVNRWGIAGATQVRNNTSDTYLRGMKRIDPQGNIRNVITMWDSTEVVKGPPSPIYGNGRIGGYTNFVPKSVRGTTGKYLERPTGSITFITGDWNRAEGQVNYQQPLRIRGQDAGVQVFALMSTAGSYYYQNFQKDRVLQASFTMNLPNRWRLESGAIYQHALNAGMAGANRVDQYSLDNNQYLRGTPLVNLDFDGNGRVSEREIVTARFGPNGSWPAGSTGVVATIPRTLTYTFALPPNGKVGTPVPGVPVNLKALLQLPEYAAAANTPAGRAILASPVGGPLGTTGVLPVTYFLNPTEVRYEERDWRHEAIEELADGKTFTYYLDFINDEDAGKMEKLQLFLDYQQQDKRSQLPFNQHQEITAVEGKYTMTRKGENLPLINRLPRFVSVELLASLNARYTAGGGASNGGDYDHRRDLVTGLTPSDTFSSWIYNGDLSFETGQPMTSDTWTSYSEYGAGAMMDVKLWNRLGLMGGFRYDYTQAHTKQGVRYDANPGRYLPFQDAESNDSGTSASISASYQLPWLGMIPYATYARANAILAGANQSIPIANVQSGNTMGEGDLKEIGLKGSIPSLRLFYGVSVYEQKRTSNYTVEGDSFIRRTLNRGLEAEIRWAPTRNFSAAFTGVSTKVELLATTAPTRTATATAEYVGFMDVKDAAGNVVYPANAFGWGGNISVTIPNSDYYKEFGGYPDHILTAFLTYNFDSGWGVSWNTSYVTRVSSSADIPDILILPEYYLSAASVYWQNRQWRVSLNVRNVLDTNYFSPNSTGAALVHKGLPRNFEFSLTRKL